MANKICSEPDCPAVIPAGPGKPARCPQHRTPSPTTVQRDWGERQRRARFVAAWIADNGPWCPGHGVPAHESHDLTADHVVPIGLGGDPRGALQALCRSCNSRKAARTV